MNNRQNSIATSGLVALIVVAAVAVGCGGDAGPMAPSIPQANPRTSAISGQLLGGGMPAPTTMSGIQVSVEGTSSATHTDGSGRFMLAGVPSGNVKLKIIGAGNNADVMVQGVGAKQLVQITIQVQPGTATVIDQRSDALDGYAGLVTAMDPANFAFTLDDGSTFFTDGNTWWDTGGDLFSYAELLTAFDGGASVFVQGQWAPGLTGAPLATVVKAEIGGLDVEDLRLSFNRSKWSLGWVDNGGPGGGSSAIEARISGGPYADIDPNSVEMVGPNGIVTPFATELEPGVFVAKFTKAQAISVAVSVPAGSTFEVLVRGRLADGTPWELTATIEITDDDDDEDEDDDTKDLDPAVAAQAIAEIQVVIDYINGLVAAGEMTGNNAKPLITSLESAIASLQKLNGTPSINKLQAFLNKLDSAEKTGKIATEDADFIEDLVQDVIALLQAAV